MALGRQQIYGNSSRGKNSVTFRPNDKRLGPVSNTIILIVLACLLGLLYLTQVTKTNAYGYTINSLQKQQTQLKDQHDDLEVASARSQSLARVQASDVAKNMTPIAPSASVQ
jgi:hypothetical protein